MGKLRAFCMPKWGIEMSEGTIAEWKVKDGQKVKKGDLICLIETDKITNEVEAEREEILLRIAEPASDDPIAVGALLAVMGEEAADDSEVDAFIDSFTPADGGVSSNAKKDAPKKAEAEEDKPARTKPAKKKAAKIDTNRPISPKALELAEAEGVDLSEIAGSGRDGRITYQDVHQHIRPAASPVLRGTTQLPEEDRTIFASPLARRLGAIHGVDLSQLKGTGPRGRISKKDVLAVAEQTSGGADRSAPFALVANEATVESFDKVRKVVAKRLTSAKQEIPHFYLRISANVDELMAMRKTANLVLGCKASVNDYIVLACAKALVKHPDINVQLHGEELHRFKHADVAVAVASPKGLLTPIVRQADRMRIEQIAGKTKELIEKANEGRLSFDEMDGGTFTISNLGMFGIEEFDAIINPPQGAILAVGAASQEMALLDDGDIGVETRIKLSLSVDHRAIDGAAGAQFLATLKGLIEEPEQLFA